MTDPSTANAILINKDIRSIVNTINIQSLSLNVSSVLYVSGVSYVKFNGTATGEGATFKFYGGKGKINFKTNETM